MSRTVNGEWLWDDVAKDVLRRQIWQVAAYCGVQVLTYTVLSNHFHVVVRVPQAMPVSDAELLRRYRLLYPQPTAYQAARLEVVASQLASNGPDAVVWRQRQLRLMGDVSQYMKLVKQRFSIWFNKSHGRFGTLWAERFRSELLGPGALEVVVPYVDLNAVRAGLVQDPKDYRFCGYAEAVSGHVDARRGLRLAIEGPDWPAVQSTYREMLFGIGGTPRAAAASIPRAQALGVLAAGGALPLATILRCRIRYLTDGAVLGSAAFVAAQLANYRGRTGRTQSNEPRPLQGCTAWQGLTIFRALRRQAIL